MLFAHLMTVLFVSCGFAFGQGVTLDLSKAALDSTVWKTYSPTIHGHTGSHQIVQGDRLELSNAEWLYLADPPNSVASVEGSFTLRDSYDIMWVTLNSGADPSIRTNMLPADGVNVSMSNRQGGVHIDLLGPSSKGLSTVPFNFSVGQIYNFLIVDDGQNLSVKINGNEVASADYRSEQGFIDGGSNVVLQNREGWPGPHTAHIHSYKISSDNDGVTNPQFTAGLYGLDHTSDELVKIDIETGAVSTVGPLGIDVTAFTGLDYDPSSGLLITSIPTDSDNVLYEINLATGLATIFKVIPKTSNADIEQLGFADNGTLYAWNEEPGFTQGDLWTVDISDGTFTKIGNSSLPNVLGADYQEGSGFWVSDEWEGRVYKLNETTAQIELTGPAIWYTGNGPGDLWDMDFGYDGLLRVAASDATLPSVLLTINQEDGSEISRVNLSREILGIASVPSSGGPGEQQPVTYLTTGHTWEYIDNGSDQGTEWRAIDFNDTAWSSGPSPLGYGGDGEATELSFGDDSGNKYATTYYRTTIEIPNPTVFLNFLLRVKYDDGVAVYINGVEQFRQNLGSNASFDDYANGTLSDSDEGRWRDATIPVSAFVSGTNTIAVEVHQASGTSSDTRMDLTLRGQTTDVGGGSPTILHYQVSAEDSQTVATGVIPGVNGSANGDVFGGAVTLSENIPTVGVPAGLGDRSMVFDGTAGVDLPGTQQLLNSVLADKGGFTFEAWFSYAGGGNINSIIDYAGTEKLVRNTSAEGARFSHWEGEPFVTLGPANPDNPPEWHYVAVVFTPTSIVDGEGNITGTFTYYYDDNEPLVTVENKVKTNFGDSLDRTIAVGAHPSGFTSDWFNGLIYSPRVTLGALAPSELLHNGEIPISLVAGSAINGSISGLGEFEAGSQTTLIATPEPGYVFTGWTEDQTGTENPLTIIIERDLTIGATFGPDTKDFDDDGLTNYAELVVYGSNPNDNDTDNDGIPDGAEVNAGLNILQPESISEAVAFLTAVRDEVIVQRDERPTFEQLTDSRLGSVVLIADAETNKVRLRFCIEESDELGQWITREEEAEVEVPLLPGKKFFRFSVKKD